MNEWMETFISRCLSKIPWGRFRRRMAAELRDHMQTQYQVLTEAGASSQEAQSRVLSTMGDPERLRKEYYIAWKQTPLCRANWIASGIIVIWGLIFLIGSLTELLTFPDILTSKGLRSAIIFFLIPFPLGALFLRSCFQEERRRAWWVTLGLLAAWASFHLYLTAGLIAIEAFDKYPHRLHGHSPLVAALERNPWMTPYLCLTFMGCLALGWLFGRKTERRYELT